ncbi:MAG TPA: asparaginase [Solirubrobacteraceae bacterium]|nr:asparaginase [Solirubrobacteraceae bacterium]
MGQRANMQARPVRLVAAGGTISMEGEHAVPALDAAQLIAAIPELAAFERLEAENVLGLPGPQIALDQALALITRATEVAAGGEGVVITTGTDTLEELAMLCALIHDSEAPIVLTGANRPASAVGADGPANLLDAITLAGAAPAHGLGVVVAFGGEIHAATTVRKVDSTGPAAFGSPASGPIGRIVEGRIWLSARPLPPPRLSPRRLDFTVPIVTAALGEDGRVLRAAADGADGLVVTGFGAGHVTPGMLHALRAVAERIPVALTVRPERGSMLHSVYGFEGSERDVRASGAVCVPFLSAVAARMALLCCLGAGLDRAGIGAALAPWDA